MASAADAQRPINERLVDRLQTAGCVRGRFAVTGESAQFTLTGERADGRPLFFWEFNDRLFNRLVGDYLEAHYPSGSARLTVEVDALSGQCTWHFIPNKQQAMAAQAERQQALVARKQQPRDRTPYGPALAALVATALRRRTLAHGHRDYCGMGLDYHKGAFRYGEVWDGYLDHQPQQTFATPQALVSWLARQSDHSLARTEEADAWYWDNQTLTRQRLEEFVR